jgi:hypothetical protein
MLAAAAVALAVGGIAQAGEIEPAEPPSDIAAETDATADIPDVAAFDESEAWAGPIDWAAVDWRADSAPMPGSARARRDAPPPRSAAATVWSRLESADGSAAVTVKHALPLDWDSKIGADFSLAPPPNARPGPVNPAALLPGSATEPSAGAAWATLSTPAIAAPVRLDRASVEARFDPTRETGRLGVSASRSLTFGRDVALTLQGGYAATGTFVAAAGIPAPVGGARIYSTEQAAKLTFLPTQTAIAAGGTISTADARWLNSLSAEQRLFAGASIVGSISEVPDGPTTASIIARYRRSW